MRKPEDQQKEPRRAYPVICMGDYKLYKNENGQPKAAHSLTGFNVQLFCSFSCRG